MNPLSLILDAGHSSTARHLSDHLEGELRGLRRVRVRRHLERCEVCAGVLRTLTLTVEALRALGAAPAPERP